MAVNAPEAGTIKELLVNEEDTVTVGQDLLRMELGSAPEGGSKPAESAKEEPKAPADKNQEPGTMSAPPKEQRESEGKEDLKEAPKKEAPKEEQPAEKEQSAPPKESKPKPESSAGSAPASPDGLGHREERRVSHYICIRRCSGLTPEGQNEPHAP